MAPLGVCEQVAQCIIGGTNLEKHQMKTLLEVTKENGDVHKAQVCIYCGASITTVEDMHKLPLSPAVPFAWARFTDDTRDQYHH